VLRTLLSFPDRRGDLQWLTKTTGRNRSQVSKELRALVSVGFLHPTTKILQRARDLLQYYALGWSSTDIDSISFEAVERPTYWIKTVAEIASTHDLGYALTGLAACELLAPLTRPNVVDVLVALDDQDAWMEVLEQHGAYRSKSSSGIRLRLFSPDRFDIGSFEIEGIHMATIPLIYAHLVSEGGRSREGADALIEEWHVRSR